jgi:hypothetical protein
MFFTQGRWLTGLLIDKLFGSISSIEELRYLRIFSFVGWIGIIFLWHTIFSKWVNKMNLDAGLIILTDVFVISCIAVTVYIGWASCLELFLSVGAGLLSGHVLFKALYGQQGYLRISTSVLLLSVGLGVSSLFLYQSAFGMFLLPFLIYYAHSKKLNPDRTVWIGIIFYLLTYVVYYLIFKYSLQQSHVVASSRVGINFDVIKKLSFFISGPLPSAFCINFLHSPRSIFSQVLYPLIMAGWIVGLFHQNKQQKIAANFLRLCVIMFFLLLIYLPSMIAIENFASYRTLFAFNLAVFILVTNVALKVFRNNRKKTFFVAAYCLYLLVSGFYNYNYQMINPLKAEYIAIRTFFEKNYTNSVKTIHFIRSDKFMFRSEFGVEAYRDEFGVPSTHRDWVPEPLTRQIVFEITGKRDLAENIHFIQYENMVLFGAQASVLQGSELIVNMNEIFNESRIGR